MAVFLPLVPLGLTLGLALFSCAPVVVESILPKSDMKPPSLLKAGPVDESTYVLGFDEAVKAVDSTFWLESGVGKGLPGTAARSSAGRAAKAAAFPEVNAVSAAPASELTLAFSPALDPGAEYRLTGEVEDEKGNRTGFLLSFCGYNPKPPELVLSEIQTSKNSSKSNPHRDFVELLALSAGNSGGVELSWASSVKVLSFRLPPATIKAGDFLVVHLAPEGLSTELDEVGTGLGLAKAVDATDAGRDFFTALGGLPDATGIVVIRQRPGAEVCDSFFYAEEAKAGPIPEGKLMDLAMELKKGGSWQAEGGAPRFEDAYRWKPSSSRSLIRLDHRGGPLSWGLSASGGQSPGKAN